MAAVAKESENRYWSYALWLALFTIFYNLAEGAVSILFGAQDETLTLFGFGLDSFIRGDVGDRHSGDGAPDSAKYGCTALAIRAGGSAHYRDCILLAGCGPQRNCYLQPGYRP
jgi:hypothetical protein